MITAIVSGLAALAPTIGKWIAGDDGEARARQIADLACSVAGVDDAATAVERINADPELAARFQVQMKELDLKFYQEDTKRLELVNSTMRVEYESSDRFKTGWRPFIGWCFGVSVGVYMLSMCAVFVYVSIAESAMAGTIIENMSKLASALSTTWSVCMIVLGVAVHKRSQDKQAASGTAQAVGFNLSGAQAALGSVLSKVGGKS